MGLFNFYIVYNIFDDSFGIQLLCVFNLFKFVTK